MHVEKTNGNVSSKRAFFLLVKSYVGAGILLLPNAFYSGGFFFSFFTFIALAVAAGGGMVMLGQVAQQVPGSFQDVSRKLGGKKFYWVVLVSVAVSQIGFSTSYLIMSARLSVGFYKNAHFLNEGHITDIKNNMRIRAVAIVIVSFIFTGLVLVRKLRKIADFSIVSTGLIILSLGIIVYHYAVILYNQTAETSRLLIQTTFNSNGAANLVGEAIFAFEGIGLVIPIQRSMQTPERFTWVCLASIICTGLLYITFAIVGFFATSKESHNLILEDLGPSASIMIACAMYSIAIILTWPLAMSPAIDILQIEFFGKDGVSGRKSSKIKWQKNALRVGLTIAMAITGYLAFDVFTHFVTWLGILFCIPLSYVFPGVLYYLAFPKDRLARILGGFMVCLGIVSMVILTIAKIFGYIGK